MPTLTAEKIAALKQLAEVNGLRILVTKNQVGIGPTGQPWFTCVYTERNTGKKMFDFRSRKATINDEFKAIIG